MSDLVQAKRRAGRLDARYEHVGVGEGMTVALGADPAGSGVRTPG